MTQSSPGQGAFWGYEHPEVKGPNALMFFTWDLSKTIEQAFKDANDNNINEFLETAQTSIDQLLQKYIEIEADPATFDGQSIRLRFEQSTESNAPLIALETSPHLEDRIIKMQARVQPGHS